MNILFIGDVFAKAGRKMIQKQLPILKKEHNIDYVFANVDNVTHGKGPRKKEIEELKSYGVSVFTCGNHSFDQKDFIETLHTDNYVLRPANYPQKIPEKDFVLLIIYLLFMLWGVCLCQKVCHLLLMLLILF